MRLTKSQGVMLSRLIIDLRPEWELPGVMSSIAKIEESAAAACQIALACAADPDARTPGAMSNPLYRPTWSVGAEQERAASRLVQLQRQRSNNVRAELAQNDRQAATPEQVRAIRAGSRWPVKGGGDAA